MYHNLDLADLILKIKKNYKAKTMANNTLGAL